MRWHMTIRCKVVKRACISLGGEVALAERLGVTAETVRGWLVRGEVPPPATFFRIVDLLQEADPQYRVLFQSSLD